MNVTNDSFKQKFRRRNVREHLLNPGVEVDLMAMADEVMMEVAEDTDQTQRVAKIAFPEMFDILSITKPGEISKLLPP